jgi:hypothetical protein
MPPRRYTHPEAWHCDVGRAFDRYHARTKDAGFAYPLLRKCAKMTLLPCTSHWRSGLAQQHSLIVTCLSRSSLLQ